MIRYLLGHAGRCGRMAAMVSLLARALVLMAALALSSPWSGRASAEPIKFGDNPWYYNHWCNNSNNGGQNLTWLFDTKCAKKFPSDFSRTWTCPNYFTFNPLGYYQERPLWETVVDHEQLKKIASTQLVNITVILVRRTRLGLFYKYLDNGLPQVCYCICILLYNICLTL